MTTSSNDTKVTCYVVDITSLLVFYNQWETSIYDSMKHLRFGSHSYVADRNKKCRLLISVLISGTQKIESPIDECLTKVVHDEN